MARESEIDKLLLLAAKAAGRSGDAAAATMRAVVEAAAKLGSLKLQMELRKGRAAQVPDNDGC